MLRNQGKNKWMNGPKPRTNQLNKQSTPSTGIEKTNEWSTPRNEQMNERSTLSNERMNKWMNDQPQVMNERMNDLPQVMNKKNEWSSPSNEQKEWMIFPK